MGDVMAGLPAETEFVKAVSQGQALTSINIRTNKGRTFSTAQACKLAVVGAIEVRTDTASLMLPYYVNRFSWRVLVRCLHDAPKQRVQSESILDSMQARHLAVLPTNIWYSM